MPSTAKLAFEAGSNTETVIAIRALTGTVLLGVYLLVTRGMFRIPRHLVGSAIGVCLASAGMNYTFLTAIHSIDISLAILIMFVHPLLIGVYYHLTGQFPLTRTQAGFGVASFVGLGLALAVDFSTISITGVGWAFASALFVTVMILLMVDMSTKVGGVTTNFHMSFWNLLLFTCILLLFQNVQWPQTTLGWISSVGNGIAYLTAFLTFLLAASLIGGSRASMLTFMEPIATILLAAAIFDERLQFIQWWGGRPRCGWIIRHGSSSRNLEQNPQLLRELPLTLSAYFAGSTLKCALRGRPLLMRVMSCGQHDKQITRSISALNTM